MNLDAISPWLLVALAAFGLVLIVVAFFLWRRASKKKASSKERSLLDVWEEFLRQLPESSREDPVVIVMGERLSGKTSLIRAVVDPSGGAGLFLQSSSQDTRLQLYPGKQRLVQEISGELLASLEPATRDALRSLWRQVALRSPVVLVALNPASPSFTPAGLRELGTLVRGKLDILTELRRRPVRVRVCLTHLDESAAGFVELTGVMEEAGGEGTLRGVHIEAGKGLDPLPSYVPLGLERRGDDSFAAMTDFAASRGPALLKSLEPFYQALLDTRGAKAAPVIDALIMTALPEGASPVVVGDPLALDVKEVEREANALSGRRRQVAAIYFGGAAAAFLSLYGFHYYRLSEARRATEAFSSALLEAQRYADQGLSSGRVLRAEAEAAKAIEALDNPIWPLLRVAFPAGKAAVRENFLGRLRSAYIEPAARPEDRSRRAYALSLLYASRGSAIGEALLDSDASERWAVRIGVPAQVVRDYVTVSKEPYDGAIPALSSMQTRPPVSLSDWKSFLQQLKDALGTARLSSSALADLQAKAAWLSGSVTDAAEAEEVAALIEAFARDHDLGPDRVSALFGPEATSRDAYEWAHDNRVVASGVLSLVEGVSLSVPSAAGKSLCQALYDLAVINRPGSVIAAEGGDCATLEELSKSPASSSPVITYQLLIEGRIYTYETTAWDTLVTASRTSAYTRSFMADAQGAGRLPFFAAGAYYPNVGAASVPGRGPTAVIPGVYTAAVYGKEVQPALNGLDARLEGFHVPVDDRAAFSGYLQSESQRYAGQWRDALRTYYASFRMSASSASSLRADVTDMIAPVSWFSDFLKAAAQSAAIAPEQDPHLRPIGDSLSEFAPIVTLMAEDKGKYPNLEKYTALLVPMLPSLDAGAPGAAAPRGTPLEGRLAPIGKLGLVMLLGEKGSPLVEVQAWLDASAMPSAFRRPFLLPVELAYKLGLSDIEQAVGAAYRGDIQPEVRPVLTKFPFAQGAEAEASAEDVEGVFGAKGSFWPLFQQEVAPVCLQGEGGSYTPRSSPFGPVKVPAGALRLAEWAERLKAGLWDDAGKAKAIVMNIKPLPLPPVRPEETVTLSYLRAGESSVYGFNQTPAFTPLAVPWATGEPSSAGLQLTATGGGDKRFKSLDVSGSNWSFYKLLVKGWAAEKGMRSWTFASDQRGGSPYTISFVFQADPWALFRVPAGVR